MASHGNPAQPENTFPPTCNRRPARVAIRAHGVSHPVPLCGRYVRRGVVARRESPVGRQRRRKVADSVLNGGFSQHPPDTRALTN